jgi:hypothetical protein
MQYAYLKNKHLKNHKALVLTALEAWGAFASLPPPRCLGRDSTNTAAVPDLE